MLVSKIDASVRLYVSYPCWPSPVGLVAWTPGRRPTGVLAIAMGRNFLRVPERAFFTAEVVHSRLATAAV